MLVYRKHIVLFIFLLMSLGTWAKGVYYTSKQLQEIAVVLGITDTISTMPDGIFLYETKTCRPLTIVKRYENIVHIGYTMFSTQQRNSLGNARCNFIERYVLYTDLPLHRDKSVEQEMKEEKIVFKIGDLSLLKSLIGDTTLTVTAQIFKNKAHTVRWAKEKIVICELGFPMDHELMRGIRMTENDDRLQTDIMMTHLEDARLSDHNKFSYLTKRDSVYVTKGESFDKTSLSSNRYFFKKPDEGYSPIFNACLTEESTANIFTNNDIPNNYTLEISQQQYNYQSKSFSVPLNQWTEYIKQQGCIPYFGVISKGETTCECLLIAQHPHMGYCHVMRVKFDISTINDKEGKIPARLNAFIPTSNIKDINIKP